MLRTTANYNQGCWNSFMSISMDILMPYELHHITFLMYACLQYLLTGQLFPRLPLTLEFLDASHGHSLVNSWSADGPLWDTYWAICNSIHLVPHFFQVVPPRPIFWGYSSTSPFISVFVKNFETAYIFCLCCVFIVLFSLFMISYFMLWLIVHRYNFFVLKGCHVYLLTSVSKWRVSSSSGHAIGWNDQDSFLLSLSQPHYQPFSH